MTTVRVAPLAGGEIDGVARVHARCFDDPWSAETLRRVLGTLGAFGIVARFDGEAAAGFALARIVADECELLSLGVAPDRRRRGAGTVLLDAAMAHAAASGARWFLLEVGELNLTAQRIYARRGLLQVGRRPDYYPLAGGGHMDALTMRAPLASPAGPPPGLDPKLASGLDMS